MPPRAVHAKSIPQVAAELGPAIARLAEASRADPAVFCAFTLRHEENGNPITLAPMHERWHDILSKHQRAVIWTFTEAGKTASISVGRVLWEIGKNPNIRILVISASAGPAKKIVKAIKGYIENSIEYRMVFPHIRPDKTDTTGLWREDAFNVVRATRSKDPTVQAVGYNGAVLGGRYDLILIDDYLDDENTYSDKQRGHYHGWLKSTIEGRKTGASRLWFIGNAWHRDDSMHQYAAEPNTASFKFPIVTESGESAWPEAWPMERIQEEITNRGPIESRRSMFCDPVADADRRFKEAYILKALELGDGRELAYSLNIVPAGYVTVTGVDLAVTKKAKSDESSLATIAVELKNERRHLLSLTAGKWGGPEIVERIKDEQRRFHSIVWVESNAAQLYIKQFVEDTSATPIRAFYTGRNKVDPAYGIESLAIEFSAGKWVVPNHGGVLTGRIDPEVRKLINEMLRYDPASHTGDRLMSVWLAREGARKAHSGTGSGKRPRRT